MMSAASVSPLLRLPQEIKDQIWEDVLQDYDTKNKVASLEFPQCRFTTSIYLRMLRPLGLYYYLGGKNRQAAAALLYVSRQINREARKVLLERFRFTLFPIFHTVTPRHLAESFWSAQDMNHIRNLEFICPWKLQTAQWTACCGWVLRKFPNLRNVLVTFVVYYYQRWVDLLRTMLSISAPYNGVKHLRVMIRTSLDIRISQLREWTIPEIEDEIAKFVALSGNRNH